MATYALGDIHGCFRTLEALLERIGFRPGPDRLWLVGDLVNRGPASLEVLRWAHERREHVLVTLGNHDLHLLGRAAGVRKPRRRDALDAVLEAPDRDELLGWLRTRPLLHREGDRMLVHAGLLPQWSVEAAEALAHEVEAELAADPASPLLEPRGGPSPGEPPEAWPEADRLRLALSVFTGLRTCTADGRPCYGFTGPPGQAPGGCLPWFEIPGRRSADSFLVFGHWAALGFRRGEGWVALDSGCAWGGPLTAVRLEDLEAFQVENLDVAPVSDRRWAPTPPG